MKTLIRFVLCLLAFNVCLAVHAQGTTAFTYQGQLKDNGTNANGAYTMIFKLYDAVSAGSQVGSTLTTSATLANGLFSVNLDFGAGAFNGNARWLGITVATDTLTPRVQVLPTPYAQFAAVAATVTNGAIMNAQLAASAVATTNIQNNAITTPQIADGAVTNRNLAVNAVNAANIQNNAVTATKILDGAVTDAKIVSVSGSKVSGAVASAIFASSATTAGTATLANSVANGSITSASIANGQVVKSLNGLTDAVTLSAGQNVTLTPSGNDIQISVTNNSTTIGPWTIDTGSITTPGGPTVQNALRFRSGGVTRLGLDVNGLGVLSYTGFTVVGNINLSGTITADTSIYSQGNITANGQMYAYGFNQTSDRQAKENFKVIDGKDVLERVASLPIQTWTFKQNTGTRHIGPMAQDFFAAFHVGTDDRHIATVDADGVALAAIQGLNQKLEDQRLENADLKARLEKLECLLNERKGVGQ